MANKISRKKSSMVKKTRDFLKARRLVRLQWQRRKVRIAYCFVEDDAPARYPFAGPSEADFLGELKIE